jgi:hypothetical protein
MRIYGYEVHGPALLDDPEPARDTTSRKNELGG